MQTEKKEIRVEFWREQFRKERKRLGRNWKKYLAKAIGMYDTYDGTLDMIQVGEGRAGLEKTCQVVQDMQRLADDGSFLVDLSRKLDSPGLYNPKTAREILQDGAERRKAIQTDYQRRITKHKKNLTT